MSEAISLENDFMSPLQQKSENINLPVIDEKGRPEGLMEWKLIDEKKGNISIRARSTIKFIFQILIGICIYVIALSSIMIYRADVPLYSKILMLILAYSSVGVVISIILYVFYPLIAPRIFDFRLGVSYVKPLSSYIHIMMWDSISILSNNHMEKVQIIRTEYLKNNKLLTIDQTNIILRDGSRIALMTRKNADKEQIRSDAQKLATRLCVPVLDSETVTL